MIRRAVVLIVASEGYQPVEYQETKRVLDRESVISYLSHLRVAFIGGTIIIPRSLYMGLKKWACVDCLINHHGFKGWRWGN